MISNKKIVGFWGCVVLILTVGFLGGCGSESPLSSCSIEDLTVNYLSNPIGIDETPTFSWKMMDDTEGQCQTNYRIIVSESSQDLMQKKYVWDSGKISSGVSVAIPYEGDSLQAEKRYYWKVFVWDRDGLLAESEQAYFEMGLTDCDWDDAQWISAPVDVIPKIQGEQHTYTISYDYMVDSAYTGFVWGADTNAYGEYYVWGLDTTSDKVELVTSRVVYENVYDEIRTTLDEEIFSKESFIHRKHTVRMEISGNHVITYVDDYEVAQTTLNKPKEIGYIGLWAPRGAYYGKYDNILVTQNQSQILYEEDFSDVSNHIFSPYYIKVTDGWAEASSGIVMVAGGEEPAPMFRKDFEIQQKKTIKDARIYASALGIYEIYLNGCEISTEFFAPGQSHYGEQIYYRTYDVTQYLQKGANVFASMIGHGKYNRAKFYWGDRLAFCAKLVIRYDDGSEDIIVTDSSWKVYTDGPVRNNDLFMGEYYDANYEVANWNNLNCDMEDWRGVEQYSLGTGWQSKCVAAEREPVVSHTTLSPISVIEPVEGTFVYDFGQNFSGVCSIQVQGEKGQVITLRHGEYLNDERMVCADDVEGTIWTQNLCTAKNTDYYVMKGSGEESYTPQFVCRGFRYVQITGGDEALALDEICALVLSSDNERTGYFECSEAGINQLYSAIYWTQLSNYVDTATDCPQRDERLPWLGDAQAFVPTASYNMNIYNFMKEYVDAIRLGQNAEGSYDDIAFNNYSYDGGNGWADAGVTIVWHLYLKYGDKRIIEDNFEAMCKYVDYLVEVSEGYLREGEGYGDHNAVSSSTKVLSNTAQCANVANLLSKMSDVMGDTEAAKRYKEIYQNYRASWQRAYINEDGSIGDWIQGDYVFGLAFGLYPDDLAQSGADKLNISLQANEYRLTTGYITTQYILPVLCQYGYSDSAYKALMQQGYPSYNYMFSHGATTLTEGWNTFYDNADGTYGINGSLNHYALGTVGGWLYGGILGINADESNPGYKHIILKPQISDELEYATGTYESMYGTIESSWRVEADKRVYKVKIPANTTATLFLPCEEYQEVELVSGEYEFRF